MLVHFVLVYFSASRWSPLNTERLLSSTLHISVQHFPSPPPFAMGNYRFRLSDMMPNAWFYKLKDMRQGAKKNHSTARGKSTRGGAPPPPTAAATVTPNPVPPPHSRLVPNRASCYYSSRGEAERFSFSPTHSKALDTHFPVDPPRGSKKRSRKKPAVKPKSVASTDPDVNTIIKQLSAVSSGCRCKAGKPEFTPEFPSAVASPETPSPTGQRDYYIDSEHLQLQCDDKASWPHSCSCRVTSSATEIIIDVDRKSSTDELHSFSKLKLPPILTKPAARDVEATQSEDKNVDSSHSCKNQTRKASPGLHRLRMRANSPRLASKKVQAHRGKKLTWSPPRLQQRKGGLSASFAVVKASSDPQRDFRDSMMEMIVANNITASKDLEELLGCYLSLNSDEYHEVIVKVFEQIWFDLTTNINL